MSLVETVYASDCMKKLQLKMLKDTYINFSAQADMVGRTKPK